ncbi:hypothetical protein [Streptomyces boninensis]|uniref:hypothetical protein n=1 Tax=Streptomyces boninensis TaxID=2039455 RepID=UPI003B222550
MSDLIIDYEFLMQTRNSLRRIRELMEKPGREMEDVSGEAMGVYELASKMDDFGDEWSYGIKQLTNFSDSAAKELDHIKRSFDEVDTKLAKALDRPAEPPRYVEA